MNLGTATRPPDPGGTGLQTEVPGSRPFPSPLPHVWATFLHQMGFQVALTEHAIFRHFLVTGRPVSLALHSDNISLLLILVSTLWLGQQRNRLRSFDVCRSSPVPLPTPSLAPAWPAPFPLVHTAVMNAAPGRAS